MIADMTQDYTGLPWQKLVELLKERDKEIEQLRRQLKAAKERRKESK